MAKTAAEMVLVLRDALATGATVISVTIDGRLVQYDRKQAIAEYRFWQREAARESGRPTFIPVRFG